MGGENDEGGFHSKHRIDKGIVHVDVSAGTDMPPGLLGAPLNATPHRVPTIPLTADARRKLADIGAATKNVRDLAARKARV